MSDVLKLPKIEDVLPNVVDPHQPTDDEDRAYNAECNRRIKEALSDRESIRVRYPYGAEDGSDDDLLGLDALGELTLMEDR